MRVVDTLTLALAVSLGGLGGVVGWHAHAKAAEPRAVAPAAARAYVEALCRKDDGYLMRRTGERLGPAPWEPRRRWVGACTGTRYIGSLLDLGGREQHVFTLLRPDGTEVVWLLTFGHDGLVAGMD